MISMLLLSLESKLVFWRMKKNAFGVKNSELEKSMKKNNTKTLADFEDKYEENVGDNGIGNDTVELTHLQRNEPPSNRSKNAQGASLSGMKLLHDSLISCILIMVKCRRNHYSLD
jgi:hypothetical protein